ncbi:MAG: disulfide bond formation protein B [PS1 clade bacterium]|uniref:Disulfide bond formation protein B n=1 Tax=PS1 clade bacterium TaxID=2175152 RepID=A0A937L689_9PROT|nr:disulfide bond formation protein B [PS1 clade bacterium]
MAVFARFMPLRARLAVVFIIALAVITAALLSEYWGGLLPCALCLKQRVAFYVALPLLALAYLYAEKAPRAMRGLLVTIGVLFLANAGLGFYHAGIEYGWWLGPASCGGGGAQALDTNALLEALKSNAMVRCDAPAFTLFGISMAGYNAIACLGLAALAFYPQHDKEA